MENFLLNTAYFPPIPYFSAIHQSGQVFIEQYENFGKQSYRNRCEIMTANGVISLPVTVAKANSKTLVKDLRIVYDTSWQKLHFKGIESAYKNSPYYEYYIDEIQPFFEKKETFLLDLNMAVLGKMMECLNIKKAVNLTTDYIPAGDAAYTDLRDTFHPKPARCKPGLSFDVRPYRQTFAGRFSFMPRLSILDLLFCCGPDAKSYL